MPSTKEEAKKEFSPVREKIHEVIFEADTPLGKGFDIFLMVLIIVSVVVVMLESVESISKDYQVLFDIFEWVSTIFFTIEYLLRLYAVYRPLKYAKSFFGIVDLLAILPSYLSVFFVGSESLLVIRALRLLRVFRIFKLGSFMNESTTIVRAMKASQKKIYVFLMFILLLVIIFGSIMYLVEGRNPGSAFDSIPRSVYWAVVTLTTVGYGDISPQTELGQFLAAIVMMLGYAVIAVPTGIVSAEFVKDDGENKENGEKRFNTQVCQYCAAEGHSDDAIYCDQCGERLHHEHDEHDEK